MDFPKAPQAIAFFVVVSVKAKSLALSSLPEVLAKCNMGQTAAKIAMPVYLQLAQDLVRLPFGPP